MDSTSVIFARANLANDPAEAEEMAREVIFYFGSPEAQKELGEFRPCRDRSASQDISNSLQALGVILQEITLSDLFVGQELYEQDCRDFAICATIATARIDLLQEMARMIQSRRRKLAWRLVPKEDPDEFERFCSACEVPVTWEIPPEERLEVLKGVQLPLSNEEIDELVEPYMLNQKIGQWVPIHKLIHAVWEDAPPTNPVRKLVFSFRRLGWEANGKSPYQVQRLDHEGRISFVRLNFKE